MYQFVFLISALYLRFLEFIEEFICILFNFIDNSCSVFEFFSEISSTSLSSVFAAVEMSFWGVMLSDFFLHFSYDSTVGFAYLRPSGWLVVLISCSLLVEIFTMFRQGVIGWFDVIFLATGLGLWLSSPAVTHVLRALGLIPSSVWLR